MKREMISKENNIFRNIGRFWSNRLLFVICCLLLVPGCSELSEQTMKQWATASDSAKNKVIAAHFADNAEYVRKCMNRMAALPDAETVSVLDAGELCVTGFRLKEKNAK
jgi:hypothetical protein